MTAPYFPTFLPSEGPNPQPVTAENILARTGGSSAAPLPAISPNLLARLFGGADPLQHGLLSAGQANGIGRQSLLDTGLAILQASGPNPYRRGIGEILASGVQAGRAGYQQHFVQEQGTADAVMQQQQQQAMAGLRQRYAGKSDLPSLTAYMHDLIGLGTPEALAGARALSEYLKSQSDNHALSFQRGLPGPDGTFHMQGYDTRSGQAVGPATPDKAPVDPAVAQAASDTRADVTNFNRQFGGQLNSKAVDAYWRASSHLNEARHGTLGSYKAAITQFIQSAEPGSQIRLGMLQYLQDIDPSVEGRADIALRKLTEGTWDPKYLDGMQRIMDQNFRETMDRYTTAYQDQISRNPATRTHLAPPDVFFGTRAMGRNPGTTEGAGGSARDRLRRAAGGRP